MWYILMKLESLLTYIKIMKMEGLKGGQELVEAEERIVLSNWAIEVQDPTAPKPKTKAWWAWMIIYTSFVLLGQSSATLLGRLYYNEGGDTVLLAALLETIGFPIIIPFALYFSTHQDCNNDHDRASNYFLHAAVYIFLGLFQAASGVLYAVGLQNLPVSTFSLLNTTQLGFSAFFSFFLNEQKFGFLILNALVLVTISSTLLIFQRNTESISKSAHFSLGFSCTLVASALYALMLSTTQAVFKKLLKRETFSAVLNMVLFQSLVASGVVMAALFASGEWRGLRREMESFERGELSYVVVMVMVAVGWQVYSVGSVGLIFEVSSLFSNVISTVSLPVVPILAVFFFHERMDGIKAISIVLSVWGFVSYVYQNYLYGVESVAK